MWAYEAAISARPGRYCAPYHRANGSLSLESPHASALALLMRWRTGPSACLRRIPLLLLCFLSSYLFSKLTVSYFFYIPSHSINWIILFNIKKKNLIKYILSWKKDFLLLCRLSCPQLFTSHQTSLSNYFCDPDTTLTDIFLSSPLPLPWQHLSWLLNPSLKHSFPLDLMILTSGFTGFNPVCLATPSHLQAYPAIKCQSFQGGNPICDPIPISNSLLSFSSWFSYMPVKLNICKGKFVTHSEPDFLQFPCMVAKVPYSTHHLVNFTSKKLLNPLSPFLNNYLQAMQYSGHEGGLWN